MIVSVVSRLKIVFIHVSVTEIWCEAWTDNESMDVKEAELCEVVEEGDPVKPGDNLVVSEPFVYAIQPQFKNKVCENCLK